MRKCEVCKIKDNCCGGKKMSGELEDFVEITDGKCPECDEKVEKGTKSCPSCGVDFK